MMHSRELREPFLDYRLVEAALPLADHRLIRDGRHKALLCDLLRPLLPPSVVTAPKRPVQTPQREWLAGPLRDWVSDLIGNRAFSESGWFDMPALRAAWSGYLRDRPDNSFFVWQWVSAALAWQHTTRAPGTAADHARTVA